MGNALTLLDKKGNASDVETEMGKADSIGNPDDGFYDFPDITF